MIRIGIIGTENSHALAFSELFNLKNPQTGRTKYEDARVVGVFGPDKETAQQIMDETHVDFIAEKPEDFFGKVDAMMVTSRRGSVHYKYSLPFIKKGIPMFIDKPFTSDYKQAMELVDEARKNKVPLCGGSGCKYVYDVKMLQRSVQSAKDDFITGSANFSLELNSIYDGFFFYAPHLTEIALTVFGYDMKSVKAYEKNGTVVVVAHYDKYDVTLNYTNGSEVGSCVLVTKGRNIYREIDLSMMYEHECDEFINMLRTNVMPLSYETLLKPVAVMSSIVESLKTNQEVAIK